MIETIKAKAKAVLKWIYDWITVIAGVVVGALSVLPDLLMSFAGIDFAPLVGPSRAAQIVAGTAILKAVVAFWQSRKAAS